MDAVTEKFRVCDAWNDAIGIKNVSNVSIETFLYDANGRRYQSTLSAYPYTQTNTTFSAAGQALEDDQGSGASQMRATYVWGIPYVNDLVSLDQATGFFPLQVHHENVQTDANYDVTSIVAYNGSLLDAMVYTPYGKLTLIASSGGAADFNFLYQGGRYDLLDQTYLFGARTEAPSLGTWVQKDPAGYVNGADIYQFAVSDPISKLDPFGLKILITGTPADVNATRNLLNYLTNLRGPNGKPLCVSNMINDLVNSTLDINIASGPYGVRQNNVPTQAPMPGQGTGSTVHFDPRYNGPLEPGSPADPAATLAHELEHAHQNLDRMRMNRRDEECDACRYENEVKQVEGIPLRTQYSTGDSGNGNYPIVPLLPPGSPTTQPSQPTTQPAAGPTTRPVAVPPTPSEHPITVQWP